MNQEEMEKEIFGLKIAVNRLEILVGSIHDNQKGVVNLLRQIMEYRTK